MQRAMHGQRVQDSHDHHQHEHDDHQHEQYDHQHHDQHHDDGADCAGVPGRMYADNLRRAGGPVRTLPRCWAWGVPRGRGLRARRRRRTPMPSGWLLPRTQQLHVIRAVSGGSVLWALQRRERLLPALSAGAAPRYQVLVTG